MKIFRFDPEDGQENGQFDSMKAIISKVLHLDNRAEINAIYLHPNGKIDYHQAVTRQLFLLVEGDGWVRGESDGEQAVRKGQAVFWERDEWHESGTESGMTAVIIDGEKVDPVKLMPLLQEDKL